MGSILLSTGTSATIGPRGGSSPSQVSFLKSIGGNEQITSMSDVSALLDGTLVKAPNRLDPGTIQLTLFLDSTAGGSNQWTTLKGYQTNKTAVTITLTLPGSITGIIPPFSGYVSGVTTPEMAAGDDAMTYTITITLSTY